MKQKFSVCDNFEKQKKIKYLNSFCFKIKTKNKTSIFKEKNY